MELAWAWIDLTFPDRKIDCQSPMFDAGATSFEYQSSTRRKKGRRLPAFSLDGSTPVAQAFLFDFRRPVGIEAVIEPGPALVGIDRAPLIGINPV